MTDLMWIFVGLALLLVVGFLALALADPRCQFLSDRPLD